MVSPLPTNAANLGRGLPSGVIHWYSNSDFIISLPTVQMLLALFALVTMLGSAIDESSTQRV
jgi:hypothetical protein